MTMAPLLIAFLLFQRAFFKAFCAPASVSACLGHKLLRWPHSNSVFAVLPSMRSLRVEPSQTVHSAQERIMKISRAFTSTIAGGILALAMAASIVGPASAQGTPDQRSACMGDAFKFCSADIPDVSRISHA